MFQKIEVDAKARERAYVAYCETDVPLATIAHALGLSETTLRRRRIPAWGWPVPRPVPGRAEGAAGATPWPGRSDDRRVDLHALADVMERNLAANVGARSRARPAKDGADEERRARALATDARTLEGLRRLRAFLEKDHPVHDDAAPPRSLAELRDELCRHLERVRHEERARRLRRAADAG